MYPITTNKISDQMFTSITTAKHKHTNTYQHIQIHIFKKSLQTFII